MNARWKRMLAAVLLAVAMIAGNTATSQAFLDKTRFVAHLGVAYFAFHHWVLGPYHDGKFAEGAPHRTSTIVKGGAALLFAVHEVRVAQKIAAKSNDPLLKNLNGRLGQLITTFGAAGAAFKSGHFAPSDVDNLNAQATSVSDESAKEGATIHDVPAAIPGT